MSLRSSKDCEFLLPQLAALRGDQHDLRSARLRRTDMTSVLTYDCARRGAPRRSSKLLPVIASAAGTGTVATSAIASSDGDAVMDGIAGTTALASSHSSPAGRQAVDDDTAGEEASRPAKSPPLQLAVLASHRLQQSAHLQWLPCTRLL